MGRKMTEEEQAIEVAKMNDVNAWPQLHLPVKNLYHEGSDWQLGVILHIDGHPYDVFEVNQFRMGGLLKDLVSNAPLACAVHHYDSFEAVVADGWVGD